MQGEVRCKVCGQPMLHCVGQERFVACASCDTPHHHDCWTYSGGCSVFGCRKAAGGDLLDKAGETERRARTLRLIKAISVCAVPLAFLFLTGPFLNWLANRLPSPSIRTVSPTVSPTPTPTRHSPLATPHSPLPTRRLTPPATLPLNALVLPAAYILTIPPFTNLGPHAIRLHLTAPSPPTTATAHPLPRDFVYRLPSTPLPTLAPLPAASPLSWDITHLAGAHPVRVAILASSTDRRARIWLSIGGP